MCYTTDDDDGKHLPRGAALWTDRERERKYTHRKHKCVFLTTLRRPFFPCCTIKKSKLCHLRATRTHNSLPFNRCVEITYDGWRKRAQRSRPLMRSLFAVGNFCSDCGNAISIEERERRKGQIRRSLIVRFLNPPFFAANRRAEKAVVA